MREIEVKLRVKDLTAVEQKLKEIGCVLTEPIRQEDTIYTKEGSTDEFEAAKRGHVALRIRRQDDGAIFTLKQQQTGETDNIEYETKVGDPEATHNILKLLGYAPQVEVKKMRRKGKLQGYEICLDEVESLGTFVELEKLTSEDADPEKVKEELLQVLESLGLSRNDLMTRGYDTQVYLTRREKGVL